MTILISDDHWQVHDPYGLNDLKEQSLRYVLETYSRKAQYIIHCADITERRTFDAELISRVSSIYSDHYDKNILQVFLAGNHCGNNRLISPMTPYVTGIRATGGIAYVIGNGIAEIGPFMLRGWDSNNPFVPYDEYDPVYLISHCRVEEWARTKEKAYSLEYLNKLGYKAVILGDTHLHQKSGSVISIGTMAPSSHKDDDLQAGFGLFDEESNIFERKLIPNYPIFRTIRITEELENINPFYVKGNIVKLIFKGKQRFTQDKVIRTHWKLTVMAMEPRSLEISPIDENEGDLPEQIQDDKIPLEQRYNSFTEAQGWSDNVKKIGEDL